MDIVEVLNHIDASTDQESWIKIGTIFKALDGLFEDFDRWSSSGSNYDKASIKDRWKSWNPNKLSHIKSFEGFLIKCAQNDSPGYRPSGPQRVKSSEELARENKEREAKAAREAEKEKTKHAKAAKDAQLLWDTATPLDNNPYLSRKGVTPAGELRQISATKAYEILGYRPKGKNGLLTGELLIYSIGDESGITTCQLIDETGNKHLLAGGRKAGCYWSVEPIGNKFQIAEGMATCLSGYESNGVNTVVAIDAAGVLAIACKLRELHPDAEITILGELTKERAINPHHLKACRAAGAYLAIPNTNGTDFNDMHDESNLEAVREAIEQASLVQDVDEKKIDIDAQITVNGRELSVYDSMLNHAGTWIENPAGAGKMKVYNWGLYKDKENYLIPSCLDLLGGEKLLEAKREDDPNKTKKNKVFYAQEYEGLELAKCVFHIAERSLKRFGSMYREPSKWLINNFPNLEPYHLTKILKWLDLQTRNRKKRAEDRYHIGFEKGVHIHLKREGGLIDWKALELIDIEKYRLIVYALEHESGKTSKGFDAALKKRYGTKANIYVNPLQSLSRDAANKLNGYHYLDNRLELKNFNYLKKPLVTCFPSLCAPQVKKHSEDIGVYCIDEIEQVLSCFSDEDGKGGIFEKYGKDDVFDQFKRNIIKADQIYIADADITEKTIQWVCNIKGIDRGQVLIVTGDKKEKNYKTTVEYAVSKNRLAGYIDKILDDLEIGQKLAISVSSSTDGRRIFEAIQEALPHLKGQLYAREIGAKEKDIKALQANPSEESKKYDYIIYTSLINTGVSIEHDTPHFTKGYGIFNTVTLSPNSCIQGLRRVRYLQEYEILVYFSNQNATARSVGQPPKELTPLINYLKDQKQADSAYFEPQLEMLLNKYGFNPEFKKTEQGSWLHSFKPEDIPAILAADDIAEPHEFPINKTQQYENLRFEIAELFNTNNLTDSIVDSYLTERYKGIPERFKRLTSNQLEDGHNSEAYQVARELFKRLLKAKVRPNEIAEIMAVVKSQWLTLRAENLLPSDWGRRPPKTVKAGTLAKLAEWWGLVADTAQYSKGVNQIVVSQNPCYKSIAELHIEPEQDKAAERETDEKEVMRLSGEGLSIRAIHEATGISKSRVGRIVQKMSVPPCMFSPNSVYNSKQETYPMGHTGTETEKEDKTPLNPVSNEVVSIGGERDLQDIQRDYREQFIETVSLLDPLIPSNRLMKMNAYFGISGPLKPPKVTEVSSCF